MPKDLFYVWLPALGGFVLGNYVLPALQQQKPEWFANPWALRVAIIIVIMCFLPLSTQLVVFFYGVAWQQFGATRLAFMVVIFSGAVVGGVLAGGGYYLFQRGKTQNRPRTAGQGDEVSKIESLLNGVPDASYRQLVAAVIYAFDPHSSLSVGALEKTPDGTRIVDVEVRSVQVGKSTLTAIDVLDLPSGRKADISAVDAADSKRKDIKADAMLICSNTGFEQEAISKAKRKSIGLISVLRQGDQRVKAIIEEEIYLRTIDITPLQATFNGDNLQNLPSDPTKLEYRGASVGAWLQLKAALTAGVNPEIAGVGVMQTFEFKKPTVFYNNGKPITLRSMAMSFTPRLQWLSQIVQLDAKTGIYDYVRGRVRLTGGNNSYTISGFDFDKATPMSSPPPPQRLAVGLKPGEIYAELTKVHGISPDGTKVADLDDLIRPDDLRLKMTPQEVTDLLKAAHK